jgi:hypothetical protein
MGSHGLTIQNNIKAGTRTSWLPALHYEIVKSVPDQKKLASPAVIAGIEPAEVRAPRKTRVDAIRGSSSKY